MTCIVTGIPAVQMTAQCTEATQYFAPLPGADCPIAEPRGTPPPKLLDVHPHAASATGAHKANIHGYARLFEPRGRCQPLHSHPLRTPALIMRDILHPLGENVPMSKTAPSLP
jgi:hypothetical protein